MKHIYVAGQNEILRQDIISQEVPLQYINDQSGTDNFLNQHLQERDDQIAKELPYMDWASILAATDNFSESNMLGQGGFGPVYKVSEFSPRPKIMPLMSAAFYRIIY